LILNHQTVGYHSVGQTEGGALGALLHWGPKAVSLAFRSNTSAHPGEKGSRHAEDVRIKTVRVNDVDFVLFNKLNQPTNLFDEVEIVEAVERVFVDLSKAQLISLGAQRTAILQTGEMNAALSAGVQLSQELHGLALAATLLEAIDNE
jgi:hypothetical protein